MATTVRVHVTYCQTKHILSLVKGSEIRELRYLFLRVFSDVLADEVSPSDVTFQRYDDGFEDYVNLGNDEKINDDLKIRALVTKKDKQVFETAIKKARPIFRKNNGDSACKWKREERCGIKAYLTCSEVVKHIVGHFFLFYNLC